MSNTERLVPQSIEAEGALLGAALYSPDAFAVAVTATEAGDYYSPNHALIHAAMTRLWMRGERKADSVIVADELRDFGDLEMIGGGSVLITLASNAPSSSNAQRYATIVQEKSLMRRVLQAGLAIQDTAFTETDIAKAVTDAKAVVDGLDLPIGATAVSPNVTEFLEQQTVQDWLVPGLLERGDRLMLTATEGAGKSTLIRQLAVQFASGIHPFESRFLEKPVKVLIVDLENSMPQIQRALRTLVISAKDNLEPDNLRIEVKTEGLDLLNRHDVRWLYDRVAMAMPDIVCIGPVYKLHNENPNDEMPARQVARVLDELRSRYGCCLLIEAHSPQGSGNRALRPIGSSLWLRWPEFGYGLRKMKQDPNRYRFEEWRGARDQRAWPEFIKKGGAWPWTAEAVQTRAFD